tara:strand:+ start:639 stop:776 length:138 start_codon:yes stop_codon:yes gene_type:complete
LLGKNEEFFGLFWKKSIILKERVYAKFKPTFMKESSSFMVDVRNI